MLGWRKVTVLDVFELGDDCVVAAGTVLRGYYPNQRLITGIPGRVVRKIKLE